eukprot:836449_1
MYGVARKNTVEKLRTFLKGHHRLLRPGVQCLSVHNDAAGWTTPNFNSSPTRAQNSRAESAHIPPPASLAANVFVSSHYRLDPEQLTSYLSRKNIAFSDKGEKVALKYCPKCPAHKDKFDNLFKLYAWKDRGSFFCHRCSAKGSWYDMKQLFGDSPAPQSSMSSNFSGPSGGSGDGPRPGRQPPQIEQPFGPRHSNHPSGSPPLPNQDEIRKGQVDLLSNKFGALERLSAERGLKRETFAKYSVGVQSFKFPDENREFVPHVCVVFPWIAVTESGEVIERIKIRSLKEKANQRLMPSGGNWGLFGFHLVPATATEIVLTEGEYDAMAVFQSTGRPAVSLPNGCNSLPPEVLPCLERFERIILWMDDDVPGQEGAEKFAKKLGYNRCVIVRPSDADRPTDGRQAKDANDFLRAGANLERLLRAAVPVPHKQIATFSDLRDEVRRELCDPKTVAGLQSLTLPSLTKILKGHRKGELTIWTGPTGIGKTTILSQVSLDYCQQGASTLWGSFEIKSARLAKTMISQYSGKNLEKTPQEYDYFADKFAELPLYFLRFFGATGIDEVLDAMDYANYVYDVEHVILDNLQFMLGSSYAGQFKFDAQDQAIEKLRKFATDKNVHVSLVIHPRKEQDGSPLGLSSVFGSAKATQEADNVVVLQNNDESGMRSIQIKKNRFSGDLGRIPYVFDKEMRIIREMSEGDMDRYGILEAYNTQNGSSGPSTEWDEGSQSAPQIENVQVMNGGGDFTNNDLSNGDFCSSTEQPSSSAHKGSPITVEYELVQPPVLPTESTISVTQPSPTAHSSSISQSKKETKSPGAPTIKKFVSTRRLNTTFIQPQKTKMNGEKPSEKSDKMHFPGIIGF